jgi:subtilisin-like proprotein convertase family protein
MPSVSTTATSPTSSTAIPSVTTTESASTVFTFYQYRSTNINNREIVRSSLNIASDCILKTLHVNLNITHARTSDISVVLVHPDGSYSILHNKANMYDFVISYPTETLPR